MMAKKPKKPKRTPRYLAMRHAIIAVALLAACSTTQPGQPPAPTPTAKHQKDVTDCHKQAAGNSVAHAECLKTK